MWSWSCVIECVYTHYMLACRYVRISLQLRVCSSMSPSSQHWGRSRRWPYSKATCTRDSVPGPTAFASNSNCLAEHRGGCAAYNSGTICNGTSNTMTYTSWCTPLLVHVMVNVNYQLLLSTMSYESAQNHMHCTHTYNMYMYMYNIWRMLGALYTGSVHVQCTLLAGAVAWQPCGLRSCAVAASIGESQSNYKH
jgi:hypothetical protein